MLTEISKIYLEKIFAIQNVRGLLHAIVATADTKEYFSCQGRSSPSTAGNPQENQ